jgi:hypothetical protein
MPLLIPLSDPRLGEPHQPLEFLFDSLAHVSCLSNAVTPFSLRGCESGSDRDPGTRNQYLGFELKDIFPPTQCSLCVSCNVSPP